MGERATGRGDEGANCFVGESSGDRGPQTRPYYHIRRTMSEGGAGKNRMDRPKRGRRRWRRPLKSEVAELALDGNIHLMSESQCTQKNRSTVESKF